MSYDKEVVSQILDAIKHHLSAPECSSSRKNVPAALMAGYMELKAVHDYMKSTDKVLSCIKLARTQINKDLGREAITMLDTAPAEAQIHKARAEVLKVPIEHKALAEYVVSLGYPPVKSADFIDEDGVQLGPIGRQG